MSEQMVEVIGPHGVHSKAIFRERRDDRVEIPVILGNEISSEARVECFNALGKFREEVFRTVVDQRMCGVKAQTVEVEVTEPVQRVVDKEMPNAVAMLVVEIDGFAPRGRSEERRVGKECRARRCAERWRSRG